MYRRMNYRLLDREVPKKKYRPLSTPLWWERWTWNAQRCEKRVATNELERSLECKPVAAETWVVPRPHQLERRLIVVKALQISPGVDAL